MSTTLGQRIVVAEILANGGGGGAQVSVQNLVERLDPLRFEVEVISLSDGPAVRRLRAAGKTVHVVSGGPSRTRLTKLQTFAGTTDFGDELTWTPESPLTGIRVLRIETTLSPSWVAWLEIEAIGRRD